MSLILATFKFVEAHLQNEFDPRDFEIYWPWELVRNCMEVHVKSMNNNSRNKNCTISSVNLVRFSMNMHQNLMINHRKNSINMPIGCRFIEFSINRIRWIKISHLEESEFQMNRSMTFCHTFRVNKRKVRKREEVSKTEIWNWNERGFSNWSRLALHQPNQIFYFTQLQRPT